jgi:hypothetical protein
MSSLTKWAAITIGGLGMAVGVLWLVPGSPLAPMPDSPLPALLLGFGLLMSLGAAALPATSAPVRGPQPPILTVPARRSVPAPSTRARPRAAVRGHVPVPAAVSRSRAIVARYASTPTVGPIPRAVVLRSSSTARARASAAPVISQGGLAADMADPQSISIEEIPPVPLPPRYVPRAVSRDRPRSAGMTSIPGALAESEWDEGQPEESEYAFPGSSIAASLPFSAALRYRTLPGGGGVRSPASLQRDVDRLTSQLYELKAHHGSPEVVDSLQRDVDRLSVQLGVMETGGDHRLSFSRSGAARIPAPEPPVPWETPASRRRACTACGSGLSGSPADPLCDGCGRALCSECYWRPGPSTLRHVCPACAARQEPGVAGPVDDPSLTLR